MNTSANVRPFLDLEASVDRWDSSTDDEDGDQGFINDDDMDEEIGSSIDHHSLNRSMDGDAPASDHDSLFSNDSHSSLFSELERDERCSGRTDDALHGRDFEETCHVDEDNGELWMVKCKKGKERYLLQYLKRYIDKFNAKDIFRNIRLYDDDCGFIYVQTANPGRAAYVLGRCPVTVHKRDGFHGLNMKVITDPVEVGMALYLRPMADVFLEPTAAWGRGPKKGSWVRLGSGKGSTALMLAVEPTEKDFIGDRMEEPLVDLSGRLYYNDPALVLGVYADTVKVAFIPRMHPSDIERHWPHGKISPEWVQTLVFNPCSFKQRQGIDTVWKGRQFPEFHFEHGLMVKTIPLSLIRPLTRFPNALEGRLLLQCNHPVVISNFPRISDWRFDIGDTVTSLSGQEGVVVEQSERGPVITRLSFSDAEDSGEEYSVGWALQKKWSIGDYVRHISGVCGVVVETREDVIVVQDIRGSLEYDFAGHVNSFRVTQRDEHAVGYRMARQNDARRPHWLEAAQLGPQDMRCYDDFNHFREVWNNQLHLRRSTQQVFVLTHNEATSLLRKTRTDKIPWKGREVLVSGNCPVKGELATIADVHIGEDTKSGLMVTVESIIQGRAGKRFKLDYDFVVDRQWELPLHLIERPLLSIFKPSAAYIHPLTFRVKCFKMPPPPPRQSTPPISCNQRSQSLADGTLSYIDPAFDPHFTTFPGVDEFNDPFDIQTSTPSWQSIVRHDSQQWLYQAEKTAGLTFKAIVNGEVAGRMFKQKKMDVHIATTDSDKRAVLQFYKREREISPNVECHPVHALVNTLEPVYVFSGPHAHSIAVRASSAHINGQLHLCGFVVLNLEGQTIDFTQPIQFLPSNACVLSVKKHITDQLQYYIGIWKETQEAALRGRSRK
ncbi:hypothetical protein VNI00_018775 [Paramarasmius palmivorus]|uniref:Uncharacterized protein n=1 Tax=Paramarasmius palmivorus TaxID=297713 RepID=A0AAW0AW90_9AGAR